MTAISKCNCRRLSLCFASKNSMFCCKLSSWSASLCVLHPIACLSLQTFLKVVNYQHLMPTRYTLDVDLKSLVTPDVVENSSKRIAVRKVGAPVCKFACKHLA